MTILDIFSWLPAKEISLEQIENIVRDEMDSLGAQEILMPALQPAEL